MKVKPYGDTQNDGAVQVSFTLPMPAGRLAREAARQLALKMGLDDPQVVYHKDLGVEYTFFIVYGKSRHSVETGELTITEAEHLDLDMDQVNDLARRHLGRKVVVVGAATGTDAHTVGLDAIMNMKGYHGNYGLERYSEFIAHNLGSQVPNEALVKRAIETRADAILVSQIVTQKNIHVTTLTELVDMVEAEGIRDRVLLLCGGPRISHELAVELGYDAGFGPGTLPSQVASFIVTELIRRKERH